MPDAAAFVRVIDAGLADEMSVSRAYQKAMHDWHRAGGRAELSPEDIVQRRPVITEADGVTPEARLIMLGRMSTFKGTPTAPNITTTQEDK